MFYPNPQPTEWRGPQANGGLGGALGWQEQLAAAAARQQRNVFAGPAVAL